MNTSLMPDPTFYPSPGLAMQAAPERIAYVTLLNVGKTGKRDAMGVINVDPRSCNLWPVRRPGGFPQRR